MMFRIYLRASTTDQDSGRAEDMLKTFVKAQHPNAVYMTYRENISGTALERPQLARLLNESNQGDYLLVESVDRLTRLSQQDFNTLKQRIAEKGLKLVVHDLPTTHASIAADETTIAGSLIAPINNLLIDLLAVMAKLDNDKRKERIKQGIQRKKDLEGWKHEGKPVDQEKQDRIVKLLKVRASSNNTMTLEEVADGSKAGIATVYRAKKKFGL